jgi:protein SCO1
MNSTGSEATQPLLPRWLALLPLAIALFALLVLFGPLRGAPSFHGTAWDPPQLAEDFELLDHTGRTVRLSDFQGRTILLFFGFVNCPDVCPLTLNRLSIVLDELRVDPSRVSVLLVSVDPERDSPEALAEYVRGFGPHVVGLTGSPEQLAAVRTSFHAHASVGHAGHEGHPMITHTTQVFGIDRGGRIRVLISPEFELETVRSDVRTLMRL